MLIISFIVTTFYKKQVQWCKLGSAEKEIHVWKEKDRVWRLGDHEMDLNDVVGRVHPKRIHPAFNNGALPLLHNVVAMGGEMQDPEGVSAHRRNVDHSIRELW